MAPIRASSPVSGKDLLNAGKSMGHDLDVDDQFLTAELAVPEQFGL